MDLIRADPHLGPKPKAHPVRHARARVPKHARRIHPILELSRDFRVPGQDGVGVFGGVGVDVGDGEGAGCGRGSCCCGDGLDGEDGREEFGRVVGFGCGLEDRGFVFGKGGAEGGFGGGVAAEGDAVFEEGGGYRREDGGEGGFVDEERLDGVAGGRVAQLGVQEDLDGHVGVGVLVDVDAAEAIGVAEDGDAGVVFDVADQFVGAAGDHEVDVFVEVEERGDDVAGGDELDGGVGDEGVG